MKKLVLIVVAFTIPLLNWAQCAMCRTQIKNNVSHGETELAAGLNLGILYLFFTPYLAVAVVAILWFRYSKRNEQKIRFSKHFRG